MTPLALERLLEVAGNTSIDQAQRIEAIRKLEVFDDDRAIKLVGQIASDPNESVVISAAAGSALAAIHIFKGSLSQASLGDLTGPAYIAFDETVSKGQSSVQRPA